MSADDDRCPDCGTPLDYTEIRTFGGQTIRRVPIRRCCEPPPSAAQLARQADDDWLGRQRRLAEER